MGRWAKEPPYPQTQAELDRYCARFVTSLTRHLGTRLVCVLLCGSWARGEAVVPTSDVDITVVVDTLDEAVADLLRRAWQESGAGAANVYGADEVQVMSREALEMYTTNAVVLWGTNPFPTPTRLDFAEDLTRLAETVARNARTLEFYPWLTSSEQTDILNVAVGKYGLRLALKTVVALRTGRFPRSWQETGERLAGTPAWQFTLWLDELSPVQRLEQMPVIARRLDRLAQSWFDEVARFRADGRT